MGVLSPSFSHRALDVEAACLASKPCGPVAPERYCVLNGQRTLDSYSFVSCVGLVEHKSQAPKCLPPPGLPYFQEQRSLIPSKTENRKLAKTTKL